MKLKQAGNIMTEDQYVNHDKYDKLDIFHAVTFDHFLHLLYTGREIEFVYQNEVYFIGNFEEGRVVCYPNGTYSEAHKDAMTMLEEVNIKNRSLRNIFEQEDYLLETVF